MIFEESTYLYWLLVLPFMVAGLLWYLHWQKSKRDAFAKSKLLKKITGKDFDKKTTIRNSIYIICVLLLILALANPKYGKATEIVKSKGIEVIFALDISKSMLAEDVAPNRLEKSKQIVSQIINNLHGDKVGLVVYSGSAFNVMPVTTDYNVAKMFVKNSNPNMISEQGTAIDQAIEIASQSFSKKTSANKVIVIFSDGEDHSENAESAAEEANKNKIKIITVGVGTDKGSSIPLREDGIVAGFQRDKDNNVVISKRNATVLKSIAKVTGQSYIDGNSSRSVINQVSNQLDSFQKTDGQTARTTGMNATFYWFLAIATLLLLIDFLVLDRKKSK